MTLNVENSKSIKYLAKAAAIINSRFNEVLYLDADNSVARNPEYLFEEPMYKERGALFWPDFWKV